MTHVPQISGLKVNQVLEEPRKHIDIEDYMPELQDGKLPNRDYVVNVGTNISLRNLDSKHSHTRCVTENDRRLNGAKRGEIH